MTTTLKIEHNSLLVKTKTLRVRIGRGGIRFYFHTSVPPGVALEFSKVVNARLGKAANYREGMLALGEDLSKVASIEEYILLRN